MAIQSTNIKNKWKIVISCGNINNRYPRKTELFYGSKREAREREAQLTKLYKSGGIIIDKKITFSKFAEKWLESYAINLAPKTLSDYKKFLKRINSVIGNIPLHELKPLHLTDFYNSLRNTPKQTSKCQNQLLSENTVLHYYALIGGILNKAIQWDIIEKNPNSKVPRPKVQRKMIKFYDDNQSRELVKCLLNEPLKTQVIIMLALDTGARRGELIGLDWENVDLANGIITIKKSLQLVNGKIIEKPPKNNSSVRPVRITPKTVEILKAYKKEQLERELLLGNKWQKTSKVFTTQLGGYMHPDTPSKTFYKFLKKYNLPKITFHGLRHTSVSLQINAGVPVQTISKRVGHSSVTTTLDIYSHIFNNAQEESVNVINDILKV